MVAAYNSTASTSPEEESSIEKGGLGDTQVHQRAIAVLRDARSYYPRNPILYVELARHYVSLGQNRPARKAFKTALTLAPHNRYVLRSAVRFFVHTGNVERAWSSLIGAPNNDPWLLACKISVTELLGKPHQLIRTARSTIDALQPSQITELAASVGTLELSAGSVKHARRLFRRSAESPSDNTVAQLRWAKDEAGLPFDPALLKTELSFEARTGQAIADQNWDDAVRHARQWQADEPFSSRPFSVGCFLTSEVTREFELTEQIANVGLMSMPYDSMFLNNRAYAGINLGQLEQADRDIALAWQNDPAPNTRVCLLATEGCLNYRRGDLATGARLYRAALDLAADSKEKAATQAALIHWIAEDIRAGQGPTPDELEHIETRFLTDKSVSDTTRAVYRANIDAAKTARYEHDRLVTATRSSIAGMKASAGRRLIAIRMPGPDDWPDFWE